MSIYVGVRMLHVHAFVYGDTGVCMYADVFRDPNLMAGRISCHSVALILYIETGL